MNRKQPQQPVRDDGWRLPDELWAEMEPLLPPRPTHPLGCHNPRVPDRAAMDAIFFVLRTGGQWNALNQTTLCSSSSAHRRFQEWTAAGVFETFWCAGLLVYDELAGIDWSWLALDGRWARPRWAGKKPAPTRPIAASAGSSVRCWWTAAACRSPSPPPGPTRTITS